MGFCQNGKQKRETLYKSLIDLFASISECVLEEGDISIQPVSEMCMNE